jgi:hypothetical protein
MNESVAGPIKEDIEFCEKLLSEKVKIPQNTIFDDKSGWNFQQILRRRSEVGLLVDLHPLLMPSVGKQFLEEKEIPEHLRHVVDGYNDLWTNAEPICGPRPTPDHARGLDWTFFSQSQYRKLRINPNGPSPYTMRDDMWFPYLTAEVKCVLQDLEVAKRQNMHSMCIASRALVSLSQAAGQPEKLHRRILGFSISHDLERLSIYGYYPEINQGKVAYYRWTVAEFNNIWENRWVCYSFVENLDRKFVPIHVNLLKELLERIPDPQELPPGADHKIDPYSAESALNLQTSLQNTIEILRQQQEEAKTRESGFQNTIETLRQQLQQQQEDAKTRESRFQDTIETLRQQLQQDAKERDEKLFTYLAQEKPRN